MKNSRKLFYKNSSFDMKVFGSKTSGDKTLLSV